MRDVDCSKCPYNLRNNFHQHSAGDDLFFGRQRIHDEDKTHNQE